MKTALITGVTDGIGKATAIVLAKAGWQIHGIGRNQKKADNLLNQLKALNPHGEHEFQCFDLSDIKANQHFLDAYKQRHTQLNFLLLNANPLPKKGVLNEQGYDPLFIIGFVSRYMFSIQLDELLQQAEGSRVMHIAQIRGRHGVDFSKLKRRSLSGVRVMLYSYAASGYMAKYFNREGITPVPHLIMDPGTVDTDQVKILGRFTRFLAKLYDLITPGEMGEIIHEHLKTVPAQKASSQLFYRKQQKDLKSKLNDLEGFKSLLALGEELSGTTWSKQTTSSTT